jgi:hypothetical protein
VSPRSLLARLSLAGEFCANVDEQTLLAFSGKQLQALCNVDISGLLSNAAYLK